MSARHLPAEIRADYLVIGRGIAGLRAAIELSQSGTVFVISKKPTGPVREWAARRADQGSSEYAQGGIAAAIGPDDSVELHERDTIRAGRGLCAPRAVRVLVTDGVRRVRELMRWGMPFDRAAGRLLFTRESAHSRRRILHARGDATGEAILQTLVARLGRCRGVHFLNHHFTIDLLVAEGPDRRCVGALVLDEAAGRLLAVSAKAVILATGGAGQLYARTTNPAVCTGDGMAMAYRAGAALQDLEFVQFHPTALAVERTADGHGAAPAFLITEALRGEGARLINRPSASGGRARFLFAYHRAGELAPRDVVARAIWMEMRRRRQSCVWLDATHFDPDYLRGRFPTVYAACLRDGIDLTKEPAPVSPAAHFFMGGIATDHDGASTLPGLYAAGEAACSGVHGANRLASNSLLEGLVFGWRAARSAIRRCGAMRPEPAPARRRLIQRAMDRLDGAGPVPSGDSVAKARAELQALMWRNAGVIRTGSSLDESISALDRFRDYAEGLRVRRDASELRNLLVLARLVARAARYRRGSVGAHYRSDCPTKGRRWRDHWTVALAADGAERWTLRPSADSATGPARWSAEGPPPS
ncbi:MAG: L-aspartate oxidase [Nitrospirota bacterium]